MCRRTTHVVDRARAVAHARAPGVDIRGKAGPAEVGIAAQASEGLSRVVLLPLVLHDLSDRQLPLEVGNARVAALNLVRHAGRPHQPVLLEPRDAPHDSPRKHLWLLEEVTVCLHFGVRLI